MRCRERSQTPTWRSSECLTASGLCGTAIDVKGESARVIGEDYGITPAQVMGKLKKIKSAIPQEDLDLVRFAHLAELKEAARGMWELYQKEGAPVTSGKDGTIVYDPETGEIVRDYSLRLSATDRLLKIQERHAKITGSDAATKVDINVNQSTSTDDELAELARQLGLIPPVQVESERLDEGE